MDIFIINKQKFEIVENHWPYAILRSAYSGEKIVYKIQGCNQYQKQFLNTKKP